MDLLVLADPDGVVDMTHEAIARRTNRPLEIIRATIAELEAPDPQSRTPDEDGARLKRLDTHRDWGWCIINFDRFHKLASEEARRAKTRERVTKYRDKVRENPHSNAPVTQGNAPKRKKRHVDVDVDVDVDTDVEEETTLPPGGGDQISESAKPGPKKEKKVKKKPDDPPAPRPRNIWWDAICDIFGMKPVTKQDKSRLGKLSRDFKLKCDAAGVAPEEIEARRDVLAARWAKNDEPAVVTPEALLKHWDSAEDQGGRMPDSRGPTEEETQEMYDAFDAKPTAVKRAEIEAFEKHLVETHQVREPETVARLAKVWADIHREEAEALAGKAAAV